MQVKTLGRLLIALACAALGTAAQAAPQSAPQTKPLTVTVKMTVTVKTAAPLETVIIKLGTAVQEEYDGADPAQRTTIYRDGQNTQKTGNASSTPQA